LTLPPLQVPSIESYLSPSAGGAPASSPADWLKDHIPQRKVVPRAIPVAIPVPLPATSAHSSWLQENRGEQNLPVPSFQNSAFPERCILVTTAVILFIGLGFVSAEILSVAAWL